jgi:hypothetical protein
MTHTARRVLFSITLAILGGLALLGAHALFVLRVIPTVDVILAFGVSIVTQLVAWFVRRSGASPA